MANENGWRYVDLINEYVVRKIRKGYEVSCTVDEIVDFLDFVTYFVSVSDTDMTYRESVESFIQQGVRYVWNIKKGDFDEKRFVKQTSSGLIVPTYDLVYPVVGEASRERKKIDGELNRYFSLFMERNCVQRSIDMSLSVDEMTRQFGVNATAALVSEIWSVKIQKYVDESKWPSQCKDIKEFVLDTDLAGMIKLPPMRDELIDFYFTVSERMMHVAQGDSEFRMTNFEEEVLAKANFDLIMNGFDYLGTADLESEAVSIDRGLNVMCNTIDRYEGISKTTKLDNPKVLKLVRELKDMRRL